MRSLSLYEDDTLKRLIELPINMLLELLVTTNLVMIW